MEARMERTGYERRIATPWRVGDEAVSTSGKAAAFWPAGHPGAPDPVDDDDVIRPDIMSAVTWAAPTHVLERPTLPDFPPCEACSGKGQLDEVECYECGGTGRYRCYECDQERDCGYCCGTGVNHAGGPCHACCDGISTSDRWARLGDNVIDLLLLDTFWLVDGPAKVAFVDERMLNLYWPCGARVTLMCVLGAEDRVQHCLTLSPIP